MTICPLRPTGVEAPQKRDHIEMDDNKALTSWQNTGEAGFLHASKVVSWEPGEIHVRLRKMGLPM